MKAAFSHCPRLIKLLLPPFYDKFHQALLDSGLDYGLEYGLNPTPGYGEARNWTLGCMEYGQPSSCGGKPRLGRVRPGTSYSSRVIPFQINEK